MNSQQPRPDWQGVEPGFADDQDPKRTRESAARTPRDDQGVVRDAAGEQLTPGRNTNHGSDEARRTEY